MAAILLAVVGLASGVFAQSAPIRAIVLDGDSAPGLPGKTFNGNYRPVINASNHVAFTARTTGTGATSGVWSDAPGAITLITQQGASAPGGGTFDSFNGVLSLWLADTGGVGFAVNALAGDSGIWVQENGVLIGVGRLGAPVPGFAGTTFSTITGPPFVAINNNGVPVFRVGTTGGATGGFTAMMLGLPSTLAVAARTQAFPPGGFVSFGIPVLNDGPIFALNASYQDTNGTNGIYRGSTGSLPLVESIAVAGGSPATGFPAGARFSGITNPIGIANPNNTIAFSGNVTGGGVTATNDGGVWIYNALGKQLVYREDQQVADLPVGVRYNDPVGASPRTPMVSDSGHLAIKGVLRSADIALNGRQAIFLRLPGGLLQTVVYETGPAPGFPMGSTVSNLSSYGTAICMNARGQIVFVCNVTLPGGVQREVLYGTDPAGRPRVLYIVNQTVLTLRPGINATLGSLFSPFTGYPFEQGGSDGRRRCLSPDGQFVFGVGYTRVPNNLGGGNGLFAITIPETCSPADIASDDGAALPPYGPGGVNNGVTEGDYNLFFANFFDANPVCDIANDDGSPLPPFGALTTNNGTTEADYNLFFAIYFDGCAL
ncbi:MAG: hypothetical protein K2X32_00185 [Phycisphaerales bacterium]|nr:hypothetical protein [Phycisphaerales bacterium]